ncbi:MAG TPA: FmdB family zinc ribbon protein [Gemmatimonadaceae bacterium]|nr:FmdB family zinc ribbon protein [Gemmatimonadaceae bacterium]
MPTYEFRCPNGHDFEKFYRSISAAPGEVECPVCGKMGERQLSGGAGLLFKGSGFYITDYGKDGKKPQTSSGSSPKGTGSESPAAKSDTSPPASSEKKPSESKPASGTKPTKGSKAGE